MEYTRKIIVEAIHEVLAPIGFKRARVTWTRPIPELVQVVWLEKSTWADAYYLRYGVRVLKFERSGEGGTANPYVEWGTAQKLPVDDRTMLSDATNLEKPVTDSARREIIQESLRKYVLPAFDAAASVEKLRRILREPRNPFYTPLVGFLLDKL